MTFCFKFASFVTFDVGDAHLSRREFKNESPCGKVYKEICVDDIRVRSG